MTRLEEQVTLLSSSHQMAVSTALPMIPLADFEVQSLQVSVSAPVVFGTEDPVHAKSLTPVK